MWLNGEEVSIWDNERLKNCIEYRKTSEIILIESHKLIFAK